ncbi:MAG: hypothetical protein ABI164_10420, partial [Acidobacteriaceae bacterium]
ITRQDSSDPCRRGGALANGEQGCKTSSYDANGVRINAPIIVTIYDKGAGSSFGANTATPPYVVEIPDDTVTAGIEYYYQAHATWSGPLEQDSQTVTVPATVAWRSLPRQKILVKSAVGAKSVGRQQRGAQPKISPKARAASLSSAQARAKANPNDAQSLYELGQSYCDANLRNACVSTMYMGLLQSQKAGSMALTRQIQTRLAAEGVTAGNKK